MEKKDFKHYLKALENDDFNTLQMLFDEELANMQDEDGNTLLHHAARLDKYDAAAMIGSFFNPFIRNNEGKTPFNVAYEYDNIDTAKIIDIIRDSWQAKHGKYEEEYDDDNDKREIPFYLTGTKDSILQGFEENNISDESLLDTTYSNGSIVLKSVLEAWKLDFINEKMPPVVEILIDKAGGDVEQVIEGFNHYIELCENEIWDEPAVYTGINEDGEEDYRYETDPDEWIRDILPLDEWDELKEQMRAYAAKQQ